MKFLFDAIHQRVDGLITDRLVAFHERMVADGQISAPHDSEAGITVDCTVDRAASAGRFPLSGAPASHR